LAPLLFGGDLIAASEAFSAVLQETCAHCLHFRRTELVQVVTGEVFGVYDEVFPKDELSPDNIPLVRAPLLHAWHFQHAYLFVSPDVAAHIRKQGFIGFSFSAGFSQFG
jgi:hypothetical protein